ncbi:MAG: hypothetical protein J0M19_11290, partial [Sphingomonadales bacterium]|nr:hypothetical protein [Sphingomonadales bacterium]
AAVSIVNPIVSRVFARRPASASPANPQKQQEVGLKSPPAKSRGTYFRPSALSRMAAHIYPFETYRLFVF